MLGEDRPLERVPAGMCQLKSDEKVVGASVLLDMGLSGRVQQSGQGAGIRGVDDELTGIGTPLGYDRAGLAPDELGPAGAEPPVTAEGQLAGRAVGLGVAPFHRLDRQPVPDLPAPDRDRPKQRRKVRAQMKVERQSTAHRQPRFHLSCI